MNFLFLAWLYWDPNREFIRLPFLNKPVAWYGVLFAGGFFVAYLLFIPLLKSLLIKNRLQERDIKDWKALIQLLLKTSDNPNHQLAPVWKRLSFSNKNELENTSSKTSILNTFNTCLSDSILNREDLAKLYPDCFYSLKDLSIFLADRLVWITVLGTVIGARLAHVLMYDWPRYQYNLIDIFKVWEGGLASHGGAIGVILAFVLGWYFSRNRYPEISLLKLFDILTIPTSLAICFIRLGNFVNQEIIGTPSTLPWAVIFAHPADGSLPLPRHPAQLYEAIAYFGTFLFLLCLWNTKSKLAQGRLFGLFFILVFGARFVIEFWKEKLSMVIDESFLSMGQYLSIPYIILGCVFFFWSFRRKSPLACSGTQRLQNDPFW